MKKYIFAGLVIELTRRCNMRCKHCGRGEAQNVTITRDIIDRIFEDVENCVRLYISGGEPMMEPDILLYLLDKVKSWTGLVSLEITSNGSILDDRIVYALENLCKAPLDTGFKEKDITRNVRLTISNDEFHISGELQKALDFYSPLFEEAQKRLGTGAEIKLNTWSPVNEEETKRRGYPVAMLVYSGRAKDLVDESIKKGMLIKIPPYNNHRLKIVGNVVHCRTMISAKGDVIVAAEDDSYASYDASAVGNIMDTSLTNIINTHQNNCVLSCNESNYINDKLYLDILGHTVDSELYDCVDLKNMLLYEINSSTLRLRQMLKKVYTILPAQDLIGELPMVLGDDNLNVLVLRIINNTHWQIKEKLKNKVDELESKFTSFINSGTAKAVRNYCEAITYMQDNGLSLIMKMRELEMQTLIDKAKSYSNGELDPNNDVVFACGESNTFANENDIGEEYAKDRKEADFYRALDEFIKKK